MQRLRSPGWVPFAALGTVVVLILLGCVLVFPAWLVDRDLAGAGGLDAATRLKATNDVRGTLLQGLAGAFFLATAFFTWRQIRIGQRQLVLSEEEQIADRFSRAVEQLGNKGLDVRLGGLYALGQVATSSSEYCDVVCEILAAYVRGRAPAAPLAAGAVPPPIADDVQAALTILGRSVGPARTGAGAIDLDGAVLAGANLRDAVLPRVNLNGSVLSKAHLEGAELRDARLVGTQLDGAWLNDAVLAGGSRLIEANLSGARLVATDLTGADLTGAVVSEHTRLIKTILSGAKLRHVQLERARYGQLVSDGDTEWPEGFTPRAEGPEPAPAAPTAA